MFQQGARRANRQICIFCEHRHAELRRRSFTTTAAKLKKGRPPVWSASGQQPWRPPRAYPTDANTPVELIRLALLGSSPVPQQNRQTKSLGAEAQVLPPDVSPDQEFFDLLLEATANQTWNGSASGSGLQQSSRKAEELYGDAGIEAATDRGYQQRLGELVGEKEKNHVNTVTAKTNEAAQNATVESALELLNTTRDLYEILRAVDVLARTPTGLKLLSPTPESKAGPLGRVIRRLSRSYPEREILAAIANLAQTLQYPQWICVLGLKYAASADSVTAMGNYLTKLKDQGSNLSEGDLVFILDKMGRHRRSPKHVRKSHPAVRFWQDDETLRILTGAENGNSSRASLKEHVRREKSNVWSTYILALGRFEAIEALKEEWEIYKEDQPAPPEEKIRESEAATSEAFARAFIQNDDFQRAWEVVQTTSLTAEDLPKGAWLRLLGHLEYCGTLPKDIGSIILSKYEEYLSLIERSLGVIWTGGEEGRHLVKDRENEKPLGAFFADGKNVAEIERQIKETELSDVEEEQWAELENESLKPENQTS
ncbi:MAG: hypothetical protein M1819_006704 [Sarea resinae]|nr:MAG: hypothetical protein M1819_006704 [Sarea resinae]